MITTAQEIEDGPISNAISFGHPIAQVIWTMHWEQMGEMYERADNFPESFWELEAHTYNNLVIDNSIEARETYRMLRPVEGVLVGEHETLESDIIRSNTLAILFNHYDVTPPELRSGWRHVSRRRVRSILPRLNQIVHAWPHRLQRSRATSVL